MAWKWSKRQEEAFVKSKVLLQSAEVLVHFSADIDLILSCDASSYGVGAVLSHRMEDGAEKPIGFMSRTLSPAEKKVLSVGQGRTGCHIRNTEIPQVFIRENIHYCDRP